MFKTNLRSPKDKKFNGKSDNRNNKVLLAKRQAVSDLSKRTIDKKIREMELGYHYGDGTGDNSWMKGMSKEELVEILVKEAPDMYKK
jgi:hypothetical protein